MNKEERIAITFGDAGENHAGMELLGTLGEKGSGFTIDDLDKLKKYFEKKEFETEYINLNIENEKAGVLIIRNYINEEKQIEIYNELTKLDWDKKYYDTRRKKVLNKHARSNIVLLEGIEQDSDYENKKGTIIDSNKLKKFKKFKEILCKTINKKCDNKADNLIAEGNRYFDLKKCGIGFHGDAERTRVICLSLGADNYPLRWIWYYKNKPVSDYFEIKLNSGDVYIMCEKAVGQEWKKSSIYTLRHAAGSVKYINIKNK